MFVSKVFFSQYIRTLDLYIHLYSASIFFPGWQEQKENYFISRWLPKEASGSEHKENIRKKMMYACKQAQKPYLYSNKPSSSSLSLYKISDVIC